MACPQDLGWKGVHMASVICFQKMNPVEGPMLAWAMGGEFWASRYPDDGLEEVCKDMGFRALLKL